MKKTLAFLTGFMLIFMLAACNQTADPVNKQEKNNEKTAEKNEKKSELTLEEVFEKSAAASESLKSFSVKMNMNQNMKADDIDMDIQTDIDMDYVAEPMAFYQKMKLSQGEETFDMESYFSEEGMFMFEPTDEQWIKFPQTMTDAFMQMAGQQQNPNEELKKLQPFVKDFTFEQDDKNFILKLNASGDKFSDFIKETASKSLPKEVAEEAPDMKFNSAAYEIIIDKETFNPVSFNVDMDMDVTAEGETMKMKIKVDSKYSNINKVEKITVPQEVIDNAVEMEM